MYKRNKIPEKYEGKELRERFFRNLFIEEQDGTIAKIILNYFTAIQNKWPHAWNNIQPELILNRSTGFISLMRFLKNCYLNFAGEDIGKIVSTEEFESIFSRINILDADFNRENYLPGSGGQSKLYNELVEKSKLV
jgi:hypothetical protein